MGLSNVYNLKFSYYNSRLSDISWRVYKLDKELAQDGFQITIQASVSD